MNMVGKIFIYWRGTDCAIVEKFKELLNESKRSPFQATGKQEPLLYNLKGYWQQGLQVNLYLLTKWEVKKQ